MISVGVNRISAGVNVLLLVETSKYDGVISYCQLLYVYLPAVRFMFWLGVKGSGWWFRQEGGAGETPSYM